MPFCTFLPPVVIHSAEYDPLRNDLFFSTRRGQVMQWDIDTRSVIATFDVGGTPGHMTLSPDGSTLYVAQGDVSYFDDGGGGWTNYRSGQVVETIDIASGSITRIEQEVTGHEGGSYDVALTADGMLFWTSEFGGSGLTPLSSMDTDTGIIAAVESDAIPTGLRQESLLIESEDNEFVLLIEQMTSNTGMHIIESGNGEIIASAQSYDIPILDDTIIRSVGDISSSAQMLVSMAVGFQVFDFAFRRVADLSAYEADGVAFSVDGALLFAFDKDAQLLTTFDTQTWEVVRVYDLGALPQNAGNRLAQLTNLDTEGFLVFETTHGGIAVLDLEAPYQTNSASAGDDRFLGTSAADRFHGLAGDDVIDGNDGDDFLFGNTGHDRLYGDDGDDELIGASGNDSLFGGAGDDRLLDGAGADQLFGGDGSDQFVLALDGAEDWISGFQPGSDIIDLRYWNLTPLDAFEITYGPGQTATIESKGEVLHIRFDPSFGRTELTADDFLF